MEVSVFGIVVSALFMILQGIIGVASWLLRIQISQVNKRLETIEKQMLTKSEFELWRQGVKNGHNK